MRLLSKSLIALLLVILSTLIIIEILPFGLAQSGTNISGIISQNSTWTSSGSPYILTGNTLVYQGVTLTIQSGVTVNLGNYYIEVNGTLSAIGNPNNMIIFNGGRILFLASSNGWNQQTNSGCIIENALMNQTSISSDKALKIDNSKVTSQTPNGGVYFDAISVDSSLISNNVITGTVSASNSVISNNVVKGSITAQVSLGSESSVISNNIIAGGISLGYFNMNAGVSGDSSQVYNNTVYGSINTISGDGTPQIHNNTVSSGGIGVAGFGSIYNNYISGCQNGISLSTPRGFGGNLACYATVKNNLIFNNTQGIAIGLTSTFGPGTSAPTISDNTIAGNSIGISLSEQYYDATPTFVNNNLQNNSKYNFYLSATNPVNASNNWWGTTDQQTINQSIYDFKNDFNLGTVNFVPFLITPNPQAPTVPTVTTTPSPSNYPTPTSAVPELPWFMVVPLLVAMFSVSLLVRHRKTAKT